MVPELRSVLAVSEAAFTILASIVIGGLISLLIWLFVRLAKKTRRTFGPPGAPGRLVAVGVLISIAGVVDLIWTQIALGDSRLQIFGADAATRWQLATEPIIVIALGVLVSIAAQMLQVMQSRQSHDSH